MDPNQEYLMQLASLSNSAAGPDLDPSQQQTPVLSAAFNQWRQRQMAAQSGGLRSGGGSAAAPLAQHFSTYVTQQPSPYVVQSGPNYAASPNTPAAMDIQGQTQALAKPAKAAAVAPAAPAPASPGFPALGATDDGGRTVQIIRAGHETFQHFDAGGNAGMEAATPEAAEMGGGSAGDLGGMIDAAGLTPEHAALLKDFAAQPGVKPQQVMTHVNALRRSEKPASFDQATAPDRYSATQADAVIKDIEKRYTATLAGRLHGFDPSKLTGDDQVAYQQALQTKKGAMDRIGQQLPQAPKAITPDIAKALLQQAGGDKTKARQLAQQAGYTF